MGEHSKPGCKYLAGAALLGLVVFALMIYASVIM